MALVVDERNRMGWVRLTPWFATEPWRSAALGPGRAVPDPDGGTEPGRSPASGCRDRAATWASGVSGDAGSTGGTGFPVEDRTYVR